MKYLSKELLWDADSQIRELDYKISKAKHKLEILKNRKNILYAKLSDVRKAIVDVQIKKIDNRKENQEVAQDLSHLLGNKLSLQNDTSSGQLTSSETIENTVDFRRV